MNDVAMHHPDSVEAALALLATEEDAQPLAGGASMVAMMNARLLEPMVIVSLRDIAALHGIVTTADGGIRIGAMTCHRETAADARLDGILGCVRAAANSIGNPTIRNMGTMGGSISLADPAADYPAALVAARAAIEITGVQGCRHLPAVEFFVDWYTTALEAGELVTAILLPRPHPGVGLYRKLAKVAGDFAIVSVALTSTSDGAVSVAIGGCGPRPISSEDANALLSNDLSSHEALASAGALLAGLADPVDDVRASANYRRLLIPRLLADVAREAIACLEAAA